MKKVSFAFRFAFFLADSLLLLVLNPGAVQALEPVEASERATTDDGRCFYISIFKEKYDDLKKEFGFERFEQNYWWVGGPDDRYIKAQEIADNFIPDHQGLHFVTDENDKVQSVNLEINERNGGDSGAHGRLVGGKNKY